MKKNHLSRRSFLTNMIAAGLANKSDVVANIVRLRNNTGAPKSPGTEQTTQARGQDSQVAPIDRSKVVRRHNPSLHRLDPLSPLSVGNGEFAFTADITGLQTFPGEYENAMPLCTMSQWGWHTTPLPTGMDPHSLRLKLYDTHGRGVGYATSSEGQRELFDWLRENPHRLNLGRIGLRLNKNDQSEAELTDISRVDQTLDLWTGLLTSRFNFEGKPFSVTTAVHPSRDLLAVRIQSELIDAGRLSVRFAFPYGSPNMQAADWNSPQRHQSELSHQTANAVQIQRRLDADEYRLGIKWSGSAAFVRESAHSFLLSTSPDSKRTGSEPIQISFVVAFWSESQGKGLPSSSTREPNSENSLRNSRLNDLPDSTAIFNASTAHWRSFWETGAAVSLDGSSDSRAEELERRVVLSQYLTAIQCAGSHPPQETGLTVNSWYGKFHLEMHWWHAAHFALWNRLPMFGRSLAWYESIRSQARSLAREQGYRGARWPKMVGPEGRDSPSPIGPLLIWQQPHPIFYAELCYAGHPGRQTLQRYREIVLDSAEFMASYAFFDQSTGRYVLGPPVIPAQENHPANETWNPTFELAYWSFGLKVAQRWRERLGMSREPTWDRVINSLSRLPTKEGVYLAHENCPQTFTERNRDHPSMLGALGFLPGNGVDKETMRRTLKKVMNEWRWDETWGWDYPLTSMTATRLGEPKIAVDALLMKTEKNRYLQNGHNWQRPNLPCYLPGNGGLLFAMAMMAGGAGLNSKEQAPGFPSDGLWKVRWENSNPLKLPDF